MEPLGVILCFLVLAVPPILAQSDSTLTPSPKTSPAGMDNLSANLEEVQVNLLVNQLAIIRILNETRASPVVPGVVLEEVRELHTNLDSMHEDVMATLKENTAKVHDCQEPQSEMYEREIQQLKQILDALNNTIRAQGNKIDENTREMGQVKKFLVVLNGSVTTLASEVEAQKMEIEESTTVIPQECRVEGNLHVNDNCSISVCNAGFLNSYQI